MFRRSTLFLALGALMQPAMAVTPQVWETVIDDATYGATGYIRFHDWGYRGPTGVGPNDFEVTSPVTGKTGFDPTRIGQRQYVVTLPPDRLTPDEPVPIWAEYTSPDTAQPAWRKANMDGQVNFFYWGYTTPISRFDGMEIDKAGNYYVARDKMKFGFYDFFDYWNDNKPEKNEVVDTLINFQPYAVSDGKGWCGSVLAEKPEATAVMAGQITFDVAFDIYLNDGNPDPNDPNYVGGPSSTQLIPNFIMRSYGSYEVAVTHTNSTLPTQTMSGNAVMNNTDPTVSPLDASPWDANGNLIDGVGELITANGGRDNPALDFSRNNLVSFLGAGVIPKGVWVSADSFNDPNTCGGNENYGDRKKNPDGTWAVSIVPEGTPCAVWHNNDFYGRAFLLRADGQRVLLPLDSDDPTKYVTPAKRSDWSDYDTVYFEPVPVPAAVWLFGSGLLGLLGVARSRKAV